MRGYIECYRLLEVTHSLHFMALSFKSRHHHSPYGQLAARQDLEKESRTKFRPASKREEEPIIPPLALFSALETRNENSTGFPNVAECAVHLELLEAFLILKQKILTSNSLDRTFNIVPKDTLHTVSGKKERKQDPTFKTRRAVKWPIYIRLAAARFLQWWTWLGKDSAGIGPDQLTMENLPSIGTYTNSFQMLEAHG